MGTATVATNPSQAEKQPKGGAAMTAQSPDTLTEPTQLEILEAYLAGHTTARQIAHQLRWEADDPRLSGVERLLRQGEFQKRVVDAQRDMAVSVIERFKRKAHRAAAVMEALAEQTDDRRVQFQAAKDILDRIGTAPAQKIADNSPQAYRDLLKELAEDRA